MISNLCHTLDCAQRTHAKDVVKITGLETELEALKLVHINQVKLAEEVLFLENKVKCYKEIETLLKEKVDKHEDTIRAYSKSAATAREIFDKQVIGQTSGHRV